MIGGDREIENQRNAETEGLRNTETERATERERNRHRGREVVRHRRGERQIDTEIRYGNGMARQRDREKRNR
jgi:hypothetical protein